MALRHLHVNVFLVNHYSTGLTITVLNWLWRGGWSLCEWSCCVQTIQTFLNPVQTMVAPFFFRSATATLTQWAIQMLCREGAVNYRVLGPCFSRDNVQRKVWHLMFISHETSMFGLPFYFCSATCVTLAQRHTSCSGCIQAENCIFGRLIKCRAANMVTVEKYRFHRICTSFRHHCDMETTWSFLLQTCTNTQIVECNL